MRHKVFALLAGLATTLAVFGCDSAESDSLSGACQVIVDTCHKTSSLGDCVDQLGSVSPSCLDCIAAHGCDYPTCQREPGCRLPLDFM